MRVRLPGDELPRLLWGYLDRNMKAVIPPIYQTARDFSEGLAAVRTGGTIDRDVEPLHYSGPVDRDGRGVENATIGGKWGYVDRHGKVVLAIDLDYAGPFRGGLALVRQSATSQRDAFHGFIDRSGRRVFAVPEAENRLLVCDFCCDRARFYELGSGGERHLAGFLGPTGKVIVQPTLRKASDFCEGVAAVVTDDNRCGYINVDGHLVLDVTGRFDRYDDFHEGLAAVRKGAKAGFIDRWGKLVIPMQFADATQFSDGVAAIRLGEKWGYIDRGGHVIISARFAAAGLFRDGLARVARSSGGRGFFDWGFIDKGGGYVVVPRFDEATDMWEGVAVVYRSRRYGLFNTNGDVVLEPEYECLGDVVTGLSVVQKSGRYGFINAAGRVVVAPQYDGASPPSEGLARVLSGDRWGYINNRGRVVIRPTYVAAMDFHEGMAAVALGRDHARSLEWPKAYGFIDRAGGMVVAPQFAWASRFSEGVSAVQAMPSAGGERGKFRFIDKSGKQVVPGDFLDAWYFTENLAAVKVATTLPASRPIAGPATQPSPQTLEKWGFIDRRGRFAILPRFDNAFPFEGRWARVEIAGKTFRVDKAGVMELIVPER